MCSRRDGEEVGVSAVEECGVEIESITSDQDIGIQQHHAFEIAAIQLAAVEDRWVEHIRHVVNQRLIVTREQRSHKCVKAIIINNMRIREKWPFIRVMCYYHFYRVVELAAPEQLADIFGDEGAVDLGPIDEFAVWRSAGLDLVGLDECG